MIAAKMREPNERAYFADQVKPLLGDDVELIGEITNGDKVALLGGATALLNPIRWSEAFGLVMTEALACGTPVITCPIGATPEIVDDGVTGFLCADHDALVEAVGRIGEVDRDAYRAAVIARFSTTRMVAEHLALYRDMLYPGRRPTAAA